MTGQATEWLTLPGSSKTPAPDADPCTDAEPALADQHRPERLEPVLMVPAPSDVPPERPPIKPLILLLRMALSVAAVVAIAYLAWVCLPVGEPARSGGFVAKFLITFDGKQPEKPWLTTISLLAPRQAEEWRDSRLSLTPADDVFLPAEGRYRVRCVFNFDEGKRPGNVVLTTEIPPPPVPYYDREVDVKKSRKPILLDFREKDRKLRWH